MRRAATLLALLALGGCGGGSADGEQDGGEAKSDRLVDFSKQPPYVNDLARDPRDRSFLLTTNRGFFRVPPDGRSVARVESSVTAQGVTVPVGTFLELSVEGPGRYLGSGHPDRRGLPQFLGVLRSEDAGRSWRVVSRLGDADIHKFVVRHGRIYGWDAVLAAIVVSKDGGRTFEEHFTPRGLILDFEVDPANPERIVASNEQQVFRSEDGGESWRAIASGEGIRLGWAAPDRLLRAGTDGVVWSSADGGSRWEEVGRLEGDPADFETTNRDLLHLALDDGTIMETQDGGRTWELVFRP